MFIKPINGTQFNVNVKILFPGNIKQYINCIICFKKEQKGNDLNKQNVYY